MKLDFKGIFPFLGLSALIPGLLLTGCAARVYVEQDSARPAHVLPQLRLGEPVPGGSSA